MYTYLHVFILVVVDLRGVVIYLLFVIYFSLAVYEIAASIASMIDEFKPHLNLLHGLRNPGMRDRHWYMV